MSGDLIGEIEHFLQIAANMRLKVTFRQPQREEIPMEIDRYELGAAIERYVGGVKPEPTRFPAQPPPGSVLRFEQTLSHGPSAQAYTYLALRVGDVWYVTGRQNTLLDWDDLAARIGNGTCHLVTEYAEIPHLPTNPLDEIGDPRTWFQTVFADRQPDNGTS